MEAILENRRLDIIAFLAFFERDRLDLLPCFSPGNVVPSEVSPNHLPFLVFSPDFPFVVLYWYGGYDFAGILVCHLKRLVVCLYKVEARGLS